MITIDQVTGDLIELLKIDSPTFRESDASAWLKAKLAEFGVDADDDGRASEVGGECGNLVARIPGTDAEPLLLNAHMDNVPPCEGVKPHLDGFIVRTDGTTVLGGDDKCGCIAILAALREIVQKDIPRPPLEIIFTVAEEVGLEGAKVVDYSKVAAKRAVVCESGGVGTITVKAPSAEKWDAVITGKAAHAGVAPERGVNAIRIASEAISEMRVGKLDEETTANVGVIDGGDARNVVPAGCRIQGEARSHDPEKLAAQMADVDRCLQEAAKRHGGSAELSRASSYVAFDIPEASAVLRMTIQAAREVGVEPNPRPTGGGSDANVFNERGIETVIISCGSTEVHTLNEHVDVRHLHKASEWLTRIVEMASA
ncbi:MAG TPA: M20/M25/M40 family metallo-hydrolase [Armatimonadota bacterium]|nr:M20/M25/M40 family metallo-hydrolase [Armatimonadota bacterium]